MTSQTTEDTGVKQRAQEAAGTATEEGRHVAGVAREQTAQVASEAAGAAKNVAGDVLKNVSDAAREQGSTQRDKVVSTLTTLTDDLRGMADQAPPGMAGDLARQAADQARALTSRLENREPAEILEDVRDFARRRPGVFLLGALAAGVVTGRLLAGARDGIAGAEAAGPTAGATPGATGTTAPTYGTGDLGSADLGTGTSTQQLPPAVPPAGNQYMPDPLSTPSQHGQPTQDPLSPETGYSGGGLSSGGAR